MGIHARTRHEIARASGLTDACVSDMEDGFAAPNLITALRLAVALRRKVTDLVSGFGNVADLSSLLPR